MNVGDEEPLESYGNPDANEQLSGKPLQVALFCAIGISFIGYLVGMRTPRISEVEALAPSADDPAAAGAIPSVWYRDIEKGNLSPNAGYASDLAKLVPTVLDTILRDNTYEDRLASVRERESRRAFFGAPPVVPHPVDPLSVASCLSCHQEGLRIGDRVASPIPHATYASCTQCHVEQQDVRSDEEWWLRNSFVGQPEPTQGTRAYQGAPPTIPHDVAMRSQCLSCHGPNGRNGLRSSHPERQSCLQCHALDDSTKHRER